ncbi:hypothetical protein QR680_010849 [Steinernema hermaphroditum]|uniref:Uncharacterized protein n=1 Tax=Steinernema hermaphroditum TaxID=289476 RepID=A0AA39IQB6_9BILA|nr:hypothetical protein QR680_010849 [Steinernema hermaphroditum]
MDDYSDLSLDVHYYRDTGISPEMRHVTIVYRFVFVVFLMSTYGRIIWTLISQRKFRTNMAYLLIVNIGIINILFLLTMFWAAIMSINERTIGHNYLRGLTTCSVFITWLMVAAVFPVLFAHADEFASEYDVDFAMYISIGFMQDEVVQNVEIPLYVGILAVHVFLISTLILKRKSLNQKWKLSSPEGRLALQTALLFIPQGLVFLSMKILQTTSDGWKWLDVIVYARPRYIAIINVTHDLLPFFYLVVLISFNIEIRKMLKLPSGSPTTLKIYVSPNSAVMSTPRSR